MKDKDISYRLVSPHIHRTSLLEREIQAFKSHFMTGLTSLNSDFILSKLDRILSQAELTLKFREPPDQTLNFQCGHTYLEILTI